MTLTCTPALFIKFRKPICPIFPFSNLTLSSALSSYLLFAYHKFQIDFDKLALLAGYKTAASACNSFAQVKKKLNIGKIDAADGKAGPATPKDKGKAGPNDEAGDETKDVKDEGEATATPVIPKKRGRKPKSQTDGDGNVVAGATPTPKKRAPKRKASEGLGSEVAKDDGSMDAGDGTVAIAKPKKRAARKPKNDSMPTAKGGKQSPVATTGETFWSENESDNDANVMITASDIPDDDLSIVKQEGEEDHRSREEAQKMAHEALLLADKEFNDSLYSA